MTLVFVEQDSTKDGPVTLSVGGGDHPGGTGFLCRGGMPEGGIPGEEAATRAVCKYGARLTRSVAHFAAAGSGERYPTNKLLLEN